MEFDKALAELNALQKKAATQIDGPLLVLAGPGTGKTQLLSTRVGYILQNTDTLPQNILCLTFTEAGVSAMRERLERFLGKEAYDITVNTYHAFGSDLLRRYPQYGQSYDAQAIDELASDNLMREILAGASYDNPLKSADTYSADLRAFMSECKRALLTPSDIRAIAKSNLDYVSSSAPDVSQTLRGFVRINKTSPALFEKLYTQLKAVPAKKPPHVSSLKQIALEELQTALEEATEKSTKPVTAWKHKWLEKDADGNFILAGTEKNRKLLAAAEVYTAYQKQLSARNLFDYDDMILRAIKALENYPEFKYTLAEQYQYILLDEFQDTNPAQFRLVELLTDNPVNEGRPNIMAVGDDDQAIYSFQGADHANMHRFTQIYRDPLVISLRENYRSVPEILDVAYNLGTQIKTRLHEQFEGITKILRATGKDLPKKATVAHYEFVSDAAQYGWVANEAARLCGSKTEKINPGDIAILAPKHKYLKLILPYLTDEGLAVRYEKRENILDKPLVRMLESMSRLVLAMQQRDQTHLDSLWPEVLSYDFWEIPTEVIWNISWQAAKPGNDWTKVLLASQQTEPVAKFFLRLKDLLPLTTLEQQLDILTGVNKEDVKTHDLPILSPFFEYFFGKESAKDTLFLEHLSDLSVLRGRLRDWRRDEESPLSLADFANFIDQHRTSDLNILNKSPHYEAADAVNVMTAYQSKGREFKAVFILAASDEVWGASSRTNSSNIGLPPNLEYIRYQGASDDERLRLLYVAITRAKSHLYLTSYASTMDGKNMRPLKYLVGQQGLQAIAGQHPEVALSTQDMQNYWHHRHLPPLKPKLTDLLEPQLHRYQLSPTHLNQFTDVTSGGPQQFFLNTILRFPKGQAVSAQFGTAVHTSLKWIHDTAVKNGRLPTEEQTMQFYGVQLRQQRLPLQEFELLLERGFKTLAVYLEKAAKTFNPTDLQEVNFRSEGVFAGPAHLSGKIDKVVLNKATKTIAVVDFKTGRGYDSWKSGVVKLHKYRQQLLVYKLLVEGSHTFDGWKVSHGKLEFVEPQASGKTLELALEFDEEELKRLKKLLTAVWTRIKNLDFPEVSAYPKNLSGIKQFEDDLIKNTPLK